MDKNLWDDIQIEINAEFEKVKMHLFKNKNVVVKNKTKKHNCKK